MVLKRPKQEKTLGPSKAKELLILQDLSPQTARKFEAGLKAIITKARYTGSPYHRSPGSKAGAVAKRAGLSSRCPPTWTNATATEALRLAISEARVVQASLDMCGTLMATFYMRRDLRTERTANITDIR
jgi:hypothetical protein